MIIGRSGSLRRPNESREIQAYEGGATRSLLAERYDLVPREAIEALGRRLALGATIHGENNWRQGGEEFRRATINHLIRHLLDYMESGNQTDMNTDAIICNAAFLCYFEAQALKQQASDPAGEERHI